MLIQSLKSAPNSNGTEGLLKTWRLGEYLKKRKMNAFFRTGNGGTATSTRPITFKSATKIMDCGGKKMGKVELRLLKRISVKMLNVGG